MDSDTIFRKTIASSFSIEGRGIHKNELVKLDFHPAKQGTNILFKQNIAGKNYDIPAQLNNVSDTSFSVKITQGRASLQTIEHLMFAIYAHGITDLIIMVNGGSEIPILDGSALNYVKTFERYGFFEYQEEVQPIIISEEIYVGDDTRYIKISPQPFLSVYCMIDFPHPMLTKREVCVECTPTFLKEQIASARTFGFLKEAEELKKQGYALGASTDNAVIFTETSTLNALRSPQEPIFHKILDLLGDLAILGRPIIGHIEAYRSGHSLDIKLAQKIIKHRSFY